jgi:hypothetical protein
VAASTSSSSSSPNASKPLIVLIGKGVCFDSGGLDIIVVIVTECIQAAYRFNWQRRMF